MSTMPEQQSQISFQRPQYLEKQEDLRQRSNYLAINFDKSFGVHWISFTPASPNKIVPDLIAVLREEQFNIETTVRQQISEGEKDRIRYQVLASEIPGVFNLGGDLQYISTLIRQRDRDSLIAFGRQCIDLIYHNATNYNLPVTTISLVQGTALGGGLEAALSANVVIAERGTKMGFPEVLFNMFPGMGAYQLLLRRLTPIQAERFILSGRTYTAEELYEMDVIDVLADKGRGEEAVWEYIKRHSRQSNGEWGLRRAIQATTTIRYDELLDSVSAWADTALQLSGRDLKHLELLIRGQRNRGL